MKENLTKAISGILEKYHAQGFTCPGMIFVQRKPGALGNECFIQWINCAPELQVAILEAIRKMQPSDSRIITLS